MPFRSTRTVRTITIGGDGKQRVETKTFTDGDEDGDGGSGGGSDFGFNSRFGGMNVRFGGGGDRGGMSSYRSTQRPQVGGRSSRREQKNPFSGLSKQSYDQIVQKCKEEGIMFEDPEFEAENASIFFSRQPPRPFEWKRPGELCDAPKYVSDGASRFDVQQGELGDCWLLAAVASLTCNSHLLNKVIIPEQNFDGPNYVGCFKFNIWHQGDWTEVVVDDRLPTYYNKLVFMHSADQNEFWSALLEKAYAKINGSYESLKGGSTSEAMEDFTGGVTESVDLQKAGPELLKNMMKAVARGSLMGCSIDADPSQLEAICDNGLVMGHAYSVTACKLVEIQTSKVSGKIPLVRVRNPWGNESEWKGAWSDSSAEWRYIPDDEKENLGLTFDDDGEFWMSFEDWKNNFQKLEICNLGPDSLDEEEAAAGKIRWEATAEVGEWIPRVNAGGCRNYLDTFASNPQYRVVLTDPDDDDDDDLCTMLVGLLQKDRRKKRKEGLDMLTIGYVIYKMKEDGTYGSSPLDTRFFKYNASVAKSPSFVNMREVCGRHKLSPGTYVIIPSTFEPNMSGQFLVRIFTEKPGETSEMDEGTGIVDDQNKHTEQEYGSEQPDPYRDQDPPPLGFDMMQKSDYIRQPAPPIPYEKYGLWGPAGSPYGPPQGYQPDPYNPYAAGQPGGYDPYSMGQPNPGYPSTTAYNLPMPGATAYNQPMPGAPYDPNTGYQPNTSSYYNNPNPAYEAGYQPNPYTTAMPSPGAGYQPSQYYPNTYPSQSGYPTPPQGQSQSGYPAPPQGQYNYQPPQSQPSYGWPSGGQGQGQYNPTALSYPYGQGEEMQRAQSSNLSMAPPGEVLGFNTGVVKLAQPQPAYRPHMGGGGFIMPAYVAGVASAPPKGQQQQQQGGVKRPGSSSDSRRGDQGYPSYYRPPSPIIKTYKEAIAFLKHYLEEEAPPMTEEDKQQGQMMKESFKRVAGEDMEIDAYELRDILNKAFGSEFKFDGFSIDVCRSMVAMNDGDMSGKLGFDEFKDLWTDLRKWKAVFKKYDNDNSGKLNSYELRGALNGSGFRLSNRTLSAIILRYSSKTGDIEFDDFVLCAIRLKTMICSFSGLDTEKQGVAVYDLDTFIQTTVYS